MSINLINYALAKKDWDKAYEDLKLLENGGRNLLRNSDFSNGMTGYLVYRAPSFVGTISFEDGVIKITSETSSLGGFFIPSSYRPQILEGQVYTISIWAKGFGTIRIGQEGVSGGLDNVTINSDDYMQYSHTFTPNITPSAYAISFYVISPTDGIYIDRIKLEKGHKATDWTPAPEDINAHPFVAELAETVYRSKQNEERIRNLENALTALGGGS